jgi:ribose transport system permease protein
MTSTEPLATGGPTAESPLPGAPPREVGRGLRDLGSRLLANYGLILVFAVVVAAFSIATPETFFTTQNAKTIATGNAVVAILALAAMLPLIVGQFDLSVGFQLGLAQTLCAGFMLKQGMPAAEAAMLTVIAGAVFGGANALLVLWVRIDSFIATLATGTIALAISQWYSKGESIFGKLPSSFTDLGRQDLLGIPLPLIYVIVVAAILWFVFEYTSWGRACFAIGGNPRAALIAGVRVKRETAICFVAAGVIAAFAGVLSVMILGSANPDVGPDLLLPAFAGAFVGATSIRPGRYNSWGTILAVYLLATGITGLQQLGAAFYIEQFFNGGALLVAVALSKWAVSRRRARSAEYA